MTTGENTATLGHEYRVAVFEAAEALFDGELDTLVSFGEPGPAEFRDLVMVGGRMTGKQEGGPISPRRGRDETLTLDVLFSAFRPGGWEQERVVGDRVFDLLRQLEQHIRSTDPTLGGLVFHSRLVSWESDGSTPPEEIDEGRLMWVLATFEAKCRVIDPGNA